MNFYKADGKKILIFSLAYVPFVGGAELAVKAITDRLVDFEFDLITLRFNKKWPKLEKIGNINVYRIATPKLLFPFAAFLKAIKLHKKNNYDAIWSIMANRAGYAALFFKTFHPKVKFLLTLQEGDPESYPKSRMGFAKFFAGPLFGKIFKRADCIQAISNYLADWAKRMGAKAPIEVVPNGVHQGESLISRTRLDGAIIITTSRLVHKNGIDILVRAVSNLKTQNLNLKLWILGGGPDKDKLRKLAQELKVEDAVEFFGHIEPEKIPDYLGKADVFVRPSRSEGLGSSFLEAMAEGLPIIGTPVGGIPDFLNDGETGLFCKVDDPKDLAEKIKRLLSNDSLYKKLSQNGRALVLKNYDWNSIANKMNIIFIKLCQ